MNASGLKGRSKTVFIQDDMIENPQKLINLISEFSKVTGYKINIQKYFYFYILATNNKK